MTGDRARAFALVAALAAGTVSLTGGPPPKPAAPTPPPAFVAPPAAPLAEAAPVVKTPLPAPRPQISKPEAKPKPKATKPPLKKSLPSCEHIRRERARMSLAEQWSAYQSASAEQIAHGKRCLGF